MTEVLVRIHNNQKNVVTKCSVQNDITGVVTQWMNEIGVDTTVSIDANLTNIQAKLIEKGATILSVSKESSGYCSVIKISIPVS